MRLEHYRKLYEKDLIMELESQDTRDLIKLIIERYSIKDWKEFELHLKEIEKENQ